MTDEYFPVRLNTLRGDAPVSFDVYVLVANHYVHYIRESEEIEKERLQKLKSKGVRKLYIAPQSETKYLKYLEDGLNTLKDPNKTKEEKSQLANDSMVTAAENAENNLETQEGFDMTKRHFSKVTDFLLSDKGALNGILGAAGCSLDNHQHAATVSSLAVSLAMHLGENRETELFELGLGALVHDLGKNKFKFDIMKPKSEFKPEELKEYKKHPQMGVDMLAGKPYITPRVLSFVMGHEELGEGKGFPEKKNLFKMDQSHQILSLCNQYDRFCFEAGLSPLEGFKGFQDKFMAEFDLPIMQGLKNILK
jgi:HD-GYP domain-containing protein (c-di-GMP phosphodiesterase class II)